jgi:hypothetical protein
LMYSPFCIFNLFLFPIVDFLIDNWYYLFTKLMWLSVRTTYMWLGVRS